MLNGLLRLILIRHFNYRIAETADSDSGEHFKDCLLTMEHFYLPDMLETLIQRLKRYSLVIVKYYLFIFMYTILYT